MDTAMFEGWGEYFFMIGSSAAALIGLMFVVVTLTVGRDRDQTERGKHFYTSPIVWHLCVVLLLSGAAIAPTMTARLFGAVAGAFALVGIGAGIRNAIGIARVPISGVENNAFDVWWYGVAPALVYTGLATAAAVTFLGSQWGPSAIAASLMGLLLVSIHAEWDLVTFLAPIAEPPSKPGADGGA
jgi:hypothetical protein